MDRLLQDLKFSLRLLLRRPWVTLATLATLGVGIGATASIFSVINSFLLQPLPFAGAERLVQVQRVLGGGGPQLTVPAPQFWLWAERAEPFEGLTVHSWIPHPVALNAGDRPQRLEGGRVKANFFAVFGAVPLVGRTFTSVEDEPGGPLVVVLSHALWQRSFAGDEGVLGRSVSLNGKSYEVIGVMPPSFRYPLFADLWLPLQLDRASQDRTAVLTVTGKLAPDVTPREAADFMLPATAEYLRLHGDPDQQEKLRVLPLDRALFAGYNIHFLLLAGSVLALLVIACANVANLQLARVGARSREIATRLALGAAPGRILRQLLTESLLLSFVGGALGLYLSRFTFDLVVAVLPQAVPQFRAVAIDGRVLAFSFIVMTLTGVGTGLVPALACRRLDVVSAMKEAGVTVGGGRGGRLWRLTLVAGEVALTTVSMITAALLVRSYVQLSRQNPGLDAAGVLSMQVALSETSYGTGADWQRLGERLVPALSVLPGVEAAAAATFLPMMDGPPANFVIEGRDAASDAGKGQAQIVGVSPGYFETLRIPLLAGRYFDEHDRRDAPPVVIVNETMQRALWPDEDPIRQRITLIPLSQPGPSELGRRAIVGVVGDVLEWGFWEEAPPVIYVPMAQLHDSVAALFTRVRPLGVMLRTRGSPVGLAESVKEEIWRFDGDLPVFSVAMLDDYLAGFLRPEKSMMRIVSLLAIVAVSLAAVGIYSVLAYMVGRRMREIGIRKALGADRRRILLMILAQGQVPVWIGLVAGVVAAAAIARLPPIMDYLYGRPFEVVSLVAVAALVLAIALVAMFLPALRASGVRATRALRFE